MDLGSTGQQASRHLRQVAARCRLHLLALLLHCSHLTSMDQKSRWTTSSCCLYIRVLFDSYDSARSHELCARKPPSSDEIDGAIKTPITMPRRSKLRRNVLERLCLAAPYGFCLTMCFLHVLRIMPGFNSPYLSLHNLFTFCTLKKWERRAERLRGHQNPV